MSVLLAVPCYQGVLTVPCFKSIMGIAYVCAEHNISTDFLVTHGESAITRGRSNMASTFLRGDWDTLAFLDSDIEINPTDFIRLLALEKPIRGAAVNLKTLDFSECLSCFKDGEQVSRESMPAEPFECHYLGGSVMLIEREVIAELSKAEELQYVDPINGPGTHIFIERVVDGALLSEDYAFCWLARKHGFSVWVDPAIKVRHYEGRVAWQG